jgi:hypothetical protein
MTEEGKRPGKEQVRAKLKEFLQKGPAEDVASVLVHSLSDRAEKMAKQKDSEDKEQ